MHPFAFSVHPSHTHIFSVIVNIAHKREISNVLYALLGLGGEHKSF